MNSEGKNWWSGNNFSQQCGQRNQKFTHRGIEYFATYKATGTTRLSQEDSNITFLIHLKVCCATNIWFFCLITFRNLIKQISWICKPYVRKHLRWPHTASWKWEECTFGRKDCKYFREEWKLLWNLAKHLCHKNIYSAGSGNQKFGDSSFFIRIFHQGLAISKQIIKRLCYANIFFFKYIKKTTFPRENGIIGYFYNKPEDLPFVKKLF